MLNELLVKIKSLRMRRILLATYDVRMINILEIWMEECRVQRICWWCTEPFWDDTSVKTCLVAIHDLPFTARRLSALIIGESTYLSGVWRAFNSSGMASGSQHRPAAKMTAFGRVTGSLENFTATVEVSAAPPEPPMTAFLARSPPYSAAWSCIHWYASQTSLWPAGNLSSGQSL